MVFDPRRNLAVIGFGARAITMVLYILAHFANSKIVVVCEPSPRSYGRMVRIFKAAGLEPPPNEPNLERLLDRWAGHIDTAYIATPPAFHLAQARACLEAGLEVLVEKPMVPTRDEANELIQVRDRTGGMLSVAFQGSFTNHVRTAAEMISSGVLGPIQMVVGSVWQNWNRMHAGQWRTDLNISGAGFFLTPVDICSTWSAT